jgi:hypothetical protein
MLGTLLLLGSLLLLSTRAQWWNGTNGSWGGAANNSIVCQDEGDFARLLFAICERDLVCRHLYFIESAHHRAHIYPPPVGWNASAPRDRRAFRNFERQLRLFDFFVIQRTEGADGGGGGGGAGWAHNDSMAAPVHTHLWPDDWFPPIFIILNASAPEPCASTFNLTDMANRLFIHIALDLMKTHKLYISRHFCPHANERLMYDPDARQFHCYCPDGKLCLDDRGNWEDMLSIQNASIIVFFFILFLAVALFGVRLMR